VDQALVTWGPVRLPVLLRSARCQAEDAVRADHLGGAARGAREHVVHGWPRDADPLTVFVFLHSR